jgi:hypothetical protein
MDECRADWVNGTKHRQAREKGENQRIKLQQGVWEVYDRGNSGVPEERECMMEKNGGRIRTRREKTGIGRKERKVQDVLWRERDDRAHVEWMGRNERGREWTREKYWPNRRHKDRKEMGWMKEIWKRRETRKKERGGG